MDGSAVDLMVGSARTRGSVVLDHAKGHTDPTASSNPSIVTDNITWMLQAQMAAMEAQSHAVVYSTFLVFLFILVKSIK